MVFVIVRVLLSRGLYEPRKSRATQNSSVHDAVSCRRAPLQGRLRSASGLVGTATRCLRCGIHVRVARDYRLLAVGTRRGEQQDAAHASVAGRVGGQERAALGVGGR